MLDADLAAVYEVTTKRLNEQVKRNQDRFPEDFAFQLTPEELANLRSRFATSSHGGRRYLPYAFTEHGAIMAANILNSPRATQMSVFVVRAFVRMRAALADNRKLAALEKELKERLNLQDAVIVDILRRFMDILDPPALPVPMVGSLASAASACGGLLVVSSMALHWVRVHSYDRFVLPRLTVENSRPSVEP
jgi:phage regulator Rha-like protein